VKAIIHKEKIKSSGWGFGSILRAVGLKKAKVKGLPKDFAIMVLDQEMKIDSGKFDIDTVNSIMALYS